MNEESRQFLAEMQLKLSQYFSGEEIETLAFVLGVDYDSLRGGTKPTKVNSLIADMARNGRLEALLGEVRGQRTNVVWPDVPADFSLPQGAGGETPAATVYQIGSLHTGGGAFIGGGVTAGGDVNAGQKSVAGDEIKGSKYVMSGDFRGAILNIESRLDYVTQSLAALPTAQPDQKTRLAALVDELKRALESIAPEQLPDAEKLTRRVGALAEEATATNPDREAVTELGDIVKRAAAKLTSVPVVMTLVASIIELVAAMIG